MFNIRVLVVIAIGLVMGVRAFCIGNASYSLTVGEAIFKGLVTFVLTSGILYLIFC